MQNFPNANTLLLGCGYTLSKVALRLAPESFVATVNSEESKLALSALGIEAHICKLSDKTQLQSIFTAHPNIKTVVDSVPPMNSDRHEGWGEGVCNVIESIKDTKVSRIIYLSTSGVFGNSDGSWVDEQSSVNPDNPKSQARLDCENLYRASNIPTTALRIVGIYGPGRGIGVSLKSNGTSRIGPASRWTNRIHVEDLATAIEKLISCPLDQRLPTILCACDDEPSKAGDVLSHYYKILNISEPIPENITSSARSALNQRVSNKLLKQITGLNLRYPSYRQGAGTEFIETA